MWKPTTFFINPRIPRIFFIYWLINDDFSSLIILKFIVIDKEIQFLLIIIFVRRLQYTKI